MEEREFTKYAFLIVAVVAIVGLLNSGFLEATGFAAKASKDPACLAAEKALAKAQTACKLAQNEYKTTPKKCDAAKKAYGLAQVSFAKTPSEKTKNLMEQKKTAMDTACTAVETAKQKQDSACAFVSQAADNKNVVCVTPASAQPTTPAPAPEAPVPTEQQAAAPAPEQQAAPQAAPVEGGINLPCRGVFPNGVCDDGLYCGYDAQQEGVCFPITQGARSGRCMADGTCNPGLTCQDGICYPPVN